MPKCTCSFSTALGDITAKRCGEDFGQLQLLVFQRLNSTNKLAMTGGVIAESAFTTPLAAADDTKIIVSPYLYNPDVAAGDSQTWGGQNQTPNGVTFYMGADGTEITAELRMASQDVIKQMKDLICEAQSGRLGVYMLDGNGCIKGVKHYSSATPPALDGLTPIPIKSLFVGDLNMKGSGEPDYNSLKIQLPAGWSDETMNASTITPEQLIADVITAQA